MIHWFSQEYWRPRTLFAIASSVGTSICTDSASTKPMIDRTFGQFLYLFVLNKFGFNFFFFVKNLDLIYNNVKKKSQIYKIFYQLI